MRSSSSIGAFCTFALLSTSVACGDAELGSEDPENQLPETTSSSGASGSSGSSGENTSSGGASSSSGSSDAEALIGPDVGCDGPLAFVEPPQLAGYFRDGLVALDPIEGGYFAMGFPSNRGLVGVTLREDFTARGSDDLTVWSDDRYRYVVAAASAPTETGTVAVIVGAYPEANWYGLTLTELDADGAIVSQTETPAFRAQATGRIELSLGVSPTRYLISTSGLPELESHLIDRSQIASFAAFVESPQATRIPRTVCNGTLLRGPRWNGSHFDLWCDDRRVALALDGTSTSTAGTASAFGEDACSPRPAVRRFGSGFVQLGWKRAIEGTDEQDDPICAARADLHVSLLRPGETQFSSFQSLIAVDSPATAEAIDRGGIVHVHRSNVDNDGLSIFERRSLTGALRGDAFSWIPVGDADVTRIVPIRNGYVMVEASFMRIARCQ